MIVNKDTGKEITERPKINASEDVNYEGGNLED